MDHSDHSVLADNFQPVGGFLPGGSISDSVCEKHGSYKELTLVLGGKQRIQGCPQCMLEKDRGSTEARVESAKHEANQARVEALFKQSGVPPRYRDESFDTYVLSPEKKLRASQSKAVEACRSFAQNFDVVLKHGGNLLLAGECGTGKTHLACSISGHLIKNGYSSLFIEAAFIVMRVQASRRFSSEIGEEDVIKELASIDLLIIDEIEEFNGEDARSILINVINARYQNKKPMVAITNIPIPDLTQKLSIKSVDRLAHKGLNIPFSWGSHRTKISNMTPPWMNHVD